jgi:hypothetical protein
MSVEPCWKLATKAEADLSALVKVRCNTKYVLQLALGLNTAVCRLYSVSHLLGCVDRALGPANGDILD